MAKKIKVLIEVDPETETTVTFKPLAAELAQSTTLGLTEADELKLTKSATVTGGGTTVDADVDADF